MATHHTDCRGSLAVLLGACSYPGQPEREAAGRPEVLPQEWQVEGGPLVAQTDLAVEVAAHSQNLQTGQKNRHHACPRPRHQEPSQDFDLKHMCGQALRMKGKRPA